MPPHDGVALLERYVIVITPEQVKQVDQVGHWRPWLIINIVEFAGVASAQGQAHLWRLGHCRRRRFIFKQDQPAAVSTAPIGHTIKQPIFSDLPTLGISRSEYPRALATLAAHKIQVAVNLHNGIVNVCHVLHKPSVVALGRLIDQIVKFMREKVGRRVWLAAVHLVVIPLVGGIAYVSQVAIPLVGIG